MKSSEKIDFNDREIWLNNLGQVVLQNNKNPKIFAERSYSWKSTIVVIDETSGGRLVKTTLSSREVKKEDWTPILPEEYKQIKRNYSEIITIRRELKLQKLFS